VRGAGRGTGGRAARSEPSGFTFVEIIFVTIVLGILLATSVPKFQQTAQRLRTEQAAFELAQLLRYAHERAVAQGNIITWTWDAEARSARLEALQDNGDAAPLTGREAHSGALPDGLSVSLTRDETPIDRIRFFPDGTSDSAAIAVSLRNDLYTITVDPTTSHVALAARSLAR